MTKLVHFDEFPPVSLKEKGEHSLLDCRLDAALTPLSTVRVRSVLNMVWLGLAYGFVVLLDENDVACQRTTPKTVLGQPPSKIKKRTRYAKSSLHEPFQGISEIRG